MYDVVVVGGGAGGLAVAASLLKRRKKLNIAIIEPSEEHYYQPAFTLVGNGLWNIKETVRPMRLVMPEGADWLKTSVTSFEPQNNAVIVEDGTRVEYEMLVVAPGLELNWEGVPGLVDALNDDNSQVVSNYHAELAPKTWELVKRFTEGTALFTQPAMPIKCAGAPQKAMYLSCSYWEQEKCLQNINVEFNTQTPGLFGVAAYVPPLMKYVERYNAKLAFQSNLVAVDGAAKKASFDVTDGDGNTTRVEKAFDMMHVTPPQRSLQFIRESPLADAGGWVDVNMHTLQHNQFPNIFSLGDAGSTPNAKTAAAVRKQAPVVAENMIAVMDGKTQEAMYEGYGSCPLTVERGKVIMAEFGYGGKIMPTLPLDSTKARRFNWFLKNDMVPHIYWDWMLRGKERMTKIRHESTGVEGMKS